MATRAVKLASAAEELSNQADLLKTTIPFFNSGEEYESGKSIRHESCLGAMGTPVAEAYPAGKQKAKKRSACFKS